MSRLVDRIIAAGGARPPAMRESFRAIHIADTAETTRRETAAYRVDAIAQITARLRAEESGASPDQLARRAERMFQQADSKPLDPGGGLAAQEFLDVPVISADDVARYAAGLPDGTDLASIVGPIAPPFDRFFIEVQGLPPKQLTTDTPHAWGVLVEARFADDPSAGIGAEADGARWVLLLSVVVEWDKGDPVGPFIRYRIPVGSDGRWMPRADRLPELGAVFPADKPPGGSREFVEAESGLKPFIVGPLLAVSFMHARNVELRLTEPPARLARAWSKRHRGRPLTRYYVLEVEPLRRLLDEEGEAHRLGLRHALHVCRGHFKTYTEEAPLLGRHVGTYWWPATVRGRGTQGRVDKDYRVNAGLGRSYEAADETEPAQPRELASADDPDAIGHGAAAHARTQNLLAQALSAAGLSPRTPAAGEPRYDLAWESRSKELWVAEVKSLTPDNQERQLRLALGQVFRYSHALEAATGREVRRVIATEVIVTDQSWRQLCAREGIALVGPAEFSKLADWSPDEEDRPGAGAGE